MVNCRISKKWAPNELAPYFVLLDGSDSFRVGFTPKEHAIGSHGCMLDGVLVRVFKEFTPEQPNSHFCALYHMNRRYALAKIVYKDVGVFVFNSHKLINTFARKNCLIYCSLN